MHTVEELKAILSTPIALLILMLAGSIISMAMQLRDARKNGAKIRALDYYLTIETFITLGTNLLAFGGLIMTDSLNWTGAVGIGFALNHLSDLNPGGRSAAVVDSIPDSTK